MFLDNHYRKRSNGLPQRNPLSPPDIGETAFTLGTRNEGASSKHTNKMSSGSSILLYFGREARRGVRIGVLSIGRSYFINYEAKQNNRPGCLYKKPPPPPFLFSPWYCNCLLGCYTEQLGFTICFFTMLQKLLKTTRLLLISFPLSHLNINYTSAYLQINQQNTKRNPIELHTVEFNISREKTLSLDLFNLIWFQVALALNFPISFNTRHQPPIHQTHYGEGGGILPKIYVAMLTVYDIYWRS